MDIGIGIGAVFLLLFFSLGGYLQPQGGKKAEKRIWQGRCEGDHVSENFGVVLLPFSAIPATTISER